MHHPVAGREDNQRVDSFAASRLTDRRCGSYGVVSLDHHVEAAPGQLDPVEPFSSVTTYTYRPNDTGDRATKEPPGRRRQ